MQHFYDGQIRRYLVQTIRALSNFVVKYGDGTLVRVPVMYGDADRQAASVLRQNSENVVNSCPRIAVYITDLQLDRDRLGDSTYVGKMHIRERDIDTSVTPNEYTHGQGRNYTVERLMPTPFKLTIKCDIWASSTDQKLQILEQILVLFNPSLEIQTTDNYIDWTSLSILNLTNVLWSSRQVPVGTESPIDVATLTFDTPIWISPPVRVKHLGVITKIITSIYGASDVDSNSYIEGLGHPLVGPQTNMSDLIAREVVTISDYKIQVYNSLAILMSKTESSVPREPSLDIPARQGNPINWEEILDQYPGKYIAGSSMLFLTQPNGTEVVGTIAVNSLDSSQLIVNWDPDTYPANDDIVTTGNRAPRSNGTFDAIIDPLKVYPGHGMKNVVAGDRFLIVEDIGDAGNIDGPDAWKSTSGADFVANANDIIEWQPDPANPGGFKWVVIFDAAQNTNNLIYQTNIYKSPGVQYVWNGVQWAKSFEGEYKPGAWRLEL